MAYQSLYYHGMIRITTFLATALCVLASGSVAAESKLPAALLQVPASIDRIFIAETSSSEFHRFDRIDGELVRAGSYYMSIGKAGPGKQRAGDQGTPLGVYFVTEQLDTSRLHEKYGVTAFPLDYPNIWDKRAQRSGDGIWLHGVDPDGGLRPRLDTDGCIALRNEDLTMLQEQFVDNVTPVVVTQELQWQSSSDRDALVAELQASLAIWADSQADGDLHALLSLYGEDFQRWGLSKSDWSTVVTRNAVSERSVTGSIDDVLLVRYPEEDELILSRFKWRQTVSQAAGAEEVIETTKRLLWQRDADNALRIVAEDEG